MAGTYYQLVVVGTSTRTWSYVTGANDYSKKITEDDAYTIIVNPDSEDIVKNMHGIVVLTETQFNNYFARIGNHPPQKP